MAVPPPFRLRGWPRLQTLVFRDLPSRRQARRKVRQVCQESLSPAPPPVELLPRDATAGGGACHNPLSGEATVVRWPNRVAGDRSRDCLGKADFDEMLSAK